MRDEEVHLADDHRGVGQGFVVVVLGGPGVDHAGYPLAPHRRQQDCFDQGECGTFEYGEVGGVV